MIRTALLRTGLFLLLLAGACTGAVAQDAAADYARVTTPDVPQAARFLDQVMGCDPLVPVVAGADRALLQCARGTVIEIARGETSAQAPPLRLRADNIDAALAGMRSLGVAVIDGPASPGRWERIDVVSPWGQTVELVGHRRRADDKPGRQLAAD